METSNATSLNTNRETALKRDAHFQAVQEACLNEAQIATMKAVANRKGNGYIGGPTDPEQGKAAAGVGALFHRDIAAYEVQTRSKTTMMPSKVEDAKSSVSMREESRLPVV